MGKREKIATMEEFWQRAEAVEDGFLFAMLTDEIVCERWPLSPEEHRSFREKERKLLDIRIFRKEKELRMFRGSTGKAFLGRILADEKGDLSGTEYFDEEQYLDIDARRSEELFSGEGKVRAVGGGIYRLPLEGFENAKVRIRNYLDYYEETGQAYVKDWRLVDLFQEEREA